MFSCALFICQPFALTASAAGPRTLNVPSQYGSIGAAINAANTGDTILVSPGTYRESLLINHKTIAIRSTSGPSQTVIQPPPGQPAVGWWYGYLNNGAPGVLSGFTITGGSSNQAGRAGGLSLDFGSDIQVTNDWITYNYSANPGGGVIVYQSNPTFANDIINNNSSGSEGGGMVAVQSSRINIVNSTFQSNQAYAGGAIWFDTSAQPVITASTFTGNIANGSNGGGEGGAIGIGQGVSGQIENNTFTSNVGHYGGAIDLESQGGGVTIAHNVFNQNIANSSPSDGGAGVAGGVAEYNGSAGQVADNTFIQNYADHIAGALVVSENANVGIVGNMFFQNSTTGTATTEGGAMYVANGTASLVANCFVGNRANLAGGAVALLNGANVSMSNNTFTSNTLQNAGAWLPRSLYVSGATASLSSNGDLMADNSGPQPEVFDEGNAQSVGTYTNDNIYTPSGTVASYGTNPGPTLIAWNSPITSPHFRGSGVTELSATFTANTCDQTGGSPAANYGVPPPPANVPEPIYRFFGTDTQTHFFTASQSERDQVISTLPVSKYGYEGVGFWAYPTQISGSVPVYRFFQNYGVGSHFYTINQAEQQLLANNPNSGWTYEGVVFYVFPSQVAGTTPLYRFVNLATGSHFFTASQAEYNAVLTTLQSEWHYEGISFYVPNGLT